MNYLKSITATVYIYHEGCILLHEHKKYRTWFPLGGHIEEDEFPYQAAIREAKEESGLEIELVKTELAPEMDLGRVERIPQPFCTYREGSADDEDFYDFIFIATPKSTEMAPLENESQVLKWFTMEELLNTDIKPHVKNTAIQVINYMKNNQYK